MIEENIITQFIRSLEPDRSLHLEKIRREAHALAIPIIRDETAALLKCFIRMKNPKRILEIGTAIGYSTLVMAEVTESEVELHTIENYEERWSSAERNFLESSQGERIKLYKGDAGEYLKHFIKREEQFDFIFLDAAKAQYSVWLRDILELMPVGAVLLSDNVLQEGSLAMSRFLIDRRDRTIHGRMRDYLYQIKHDERLESSIIPIGDGLSVSIRVK